MRILVLGVTGMMGHMTAMILGQRHEVFGTLRGRVSDTPRLERFIEPENCLEAVDALDREQLSEVMTHVSPDVIVNCVGVVKQSVVAERAISVVETNALLPHVICAFAEPLGSYVIHLSTDCVFSGRRGKYTETDIPDPIDLYGRSKLAGETEAGQGLTIRTSIVGRELSGQHGLFEWMHSQAGGVVRGYPRAVFSGLTTRALATQIAEVVSAEVRPVGTWHVAGPAISKHDLLSGLNEAAELNVRIIPSGSVVIDRSLDGSAFALATGITSPSWENMMKDYVSDLPLYD